MNHTTRCHPRTLRDAFGMSPEDAVAIHKYTTPLPKRFFFALCRWGWAIVPAVLAVSVLTGCVDMESEELSAADLRDAVAQANTVAEVK